jgi:hypothetical protein
MLTSNTFPVYRSRKKVFGRKIKSVRLVSARESRVFMFEDSPDEELVIPFSELDKKPYALAGMYLVMYEGGYFSFSPAKEFEEGNYCIDGEVDFAEVLLHIRSNGGQVTKKTWHNGLRLFIDYQDADGSERFRVADGVGRTWIWNPTSCDILDKDWVLL